MVSPLQNNHVLRKAMAAKKNCMHRHRNQTSLSIETPISAIDHDCLPADAGKCNGEDQTTKQRSTNADTQICEQPRNTHADRHRCEKLDAKRAELRPR